MGSTRFFAVLPTSIADQSAERGMRVTSLASPPRAAEVTRPLDASRRSTRPPYFETRPPLTPAEPALLPNFPRKPSLEGDAFLRTSNVFCDGGAASFFEAALPFNFAADRFRLAVDPPLFADVRLPLDPALFLLI